MHFTCKEKVHLVNIIFTNLFKKCRIKVHVFQSSYEVQCYGLLLSNIFWNLKQMISHVKITYWLYFPVVKKVVNLVYEVKLSVVFLFLLSIYFYGYGFTSMKPNCINSVIRQDFSLQNNPKYLDASNRAFWEELGIVGAVS